MSFVVLSTGCVEGSGRQLQGGADTVRSAHLDVAQVSLLTEKQWGGETGGVLRGQFHVKLLHRDPRRLFIPQQAAV